MHYVRGRALRSFASSGARLIPSPYFGIFTAYNANPLGGFASRHVSPHLKMELVGKHFLMDDFKTNNSNWKT